MKNITELELAPSIVTLTALWSRLRELGASSLYAFEGGTVSIVFADGAGVDRAYASLVELGFATHPKLAPRNIQHDGRWHRDATVCIGGGTHLMLTARVPGPVLEVV
jgi:hypothetical protein